MTKQDLIKDKANKLQYNLHYHFLNTDDNWNIPNNMPFMNEFLRDIENLCNEILTVNQPH